MQTIGRRQIDDVWYVAEVDTNADPEGLYHWHVKKLPRTGGIPVLGNLTVFGVEAGFEAARRRALEALEEEGHSKSAVD